MSSSLNKEDFYRFMDSSTGFFTREQVVEALMPEWDDSPERLWKRVVSWSSQHRDMWSRCRDMALPLRRG